MIYRFLFYVIAPALVALGFAINRQPGAALFVSLAAALASLIDLCFLPRRLAAMRAAAVAEVQAREAAK